ncbi:hypothetical protein [Parahaliea mediterranea]|uniref:hypothetical protein n=1 Tax=Parahaliea mediterranea TaxID=651086 RepID=UPI000E2F1D2E|nr:hypothetical protein [Parahaliea mediterranea]
MSKQLTTLLTAFFFALGLLVQAGAASACAGGMAAGDASSEVESEAASGVAAHAQHGASMSLDLPDLPADPDCCNSDGERCPMQACFTGAALPCQSESLQLPPLASQLPLAPVKAATPACSRFERPPIVA